MPGSSQEHVTLLIKERTVPVLEITEAVACSGKTQLLYYLIALSLLPANLKGVRFGKENAVVLLDLSSRFSILRLYDVMKQHVSSLCSTSSTDLSGQDVSALISESLKHLHIFRPQSSSALLATVASLSDYLLKQPSSHFSTNRPLGLLAMNDVGSFLWQDRLDVEEEALSSGTFHTEANRNSLLNERYHTLVASLRNTQRHFSCAIVATSWSMAPVSTKSGHAALRQSLPSVWSNFCTVKIVVERDQVPKFAPGASAREAMTQSSQRWEAVSKSTFTGWVNWWDSEAWREEVREAVKALTRGGSFTFRITARGVEMK